MATNSITQPVIVALIGSTANHCALVSKLSQEVKLDAIIIERRKLKPNKSFSFWLSKIADRLLFFTIHNSWQKLQSYYSKQFPQLPDAELIETNNINSDSVIQKLLALNPRFLIVSGTSLIRKELINALPNTLIFNLHTGLSPYIKGGPNCTNWCIAIGKPYLIGNTVMWLDTGIDSGSILASELTPQLGNESLYELHLKVMEHAHTLYIRTIKQVIDKPQSYPGVKQSSITKGTVFLTKMWTFRYKYLLLVNLLRKERLLKSQQKAKAELQLITLQPSKDQ